MRRHDPKLAEKWRLIMDDLLTSYFRGREPGMPVVADAPPLSGQPCETVGGSFHSDDFPTSFPEYLVPDDASDARRLLEDHGNRYPFTPRNGYDFIKELGLLPEAYGIRMSVDRRLFRMSTGEFGLGPDGARVGDMICIILGASVPFVLRRTDPASFLARFDSWRPLTARLIGGCWVKSVMHGEAVEVDACWFIGCWSERKL